MRNRLCVTVTAGTMAELRERRDRAGDAELVELRVDTVRDPSAAGALIGRRGRVIFTCRPKWEGGFFEGSEEERSRMLTEAHQLGADYVDVEWRAGFTDLLTSTRGNGIILSQHDFVGGVPTDLESRAAAMRATGAQVIKISLMAGRLSDCLALRRIPSDESSPAVLLAMGDAGIATRVLPARFGSCWTYAGDGVAPGQLSVSTLRCRFGFDALTDATAVYGVVGRPVMHSVSPVLHNSAFKAAGIDAVYLPLAATDFNDFLSFAEGIDLAGASVTAPFKLAAFEASMVRDSMAQRLGAVNTLKRDERGWAACNTDVPGFLAPLEAVQPIRGLRATVLGTGGAARAVAVGLRKAGAKVSIAGRRAERTQAVARLCGAHPVAWPPPADTWDLLVNATPVGTSPDVSETPLPGGPFTGQLVYDLVYNPPETRLLREARAAGCRTISGLAMLVAQAQHQFEYWTGIWPDKGGMLDAGLQALQGEA